MYYNTRKIAISIGWVIIGITLITLSMMGILESSMYAGMGGGLAGVGMLQILRNIRYHKDEKYQRRVDIELQDERNRYVRMKAWAWTGYIFVLGAGIAGCALAVMGLMEYGRILSYCICAVLATYWIAYLILLKKY